jgi:hypothetical protein
MYSLSMFVTIFANYVMGFPVSPGIVFDVTVQGEGRERTSIASQNVQQKRTFKNVAIGIDLESDMVYFHNFLCGRTKTGGPVVIQAQWQALIGVRL